MPETPDPGENPAFTVVDKRRKPNYEVPNYEAPTPEAKPPLPDRPRSQDAEDMITYTLLQMPNHGEGDDALNLTINSVINDYRRHLMDHEGDGTAAAPEKAYSDFVVAVRTPIPGESAQQQMFHRRLES